MALGRAQLDLLRKHHKLLVDNITDLETILDHLFGEKVINDNTQGKIKREKDPRERNRMLLEHIKKRPLTDYQKFLKVLCLTENEHLAELLEPGIVGRVNAGTGVEESSVCSYGESGTTKLHTVDHGRGGRAQAGGNRQVSRQADADEDEDDTSVLMMGEDWQDSRDSGDGAATNSDVYTMPTAWPLEERLTSQVTVRVVKSADMKRKFLRLRDCDVNLQEHDVAYRMCGRGRAIIISNKIFHDQSKNRHGNEPDENRMKSLLEGLAFDVDVWNDKTEDDLFKNGGLLSVESRFGHDKYDCFLMVVLTHGQRDKIMTADNHYVKLERIIEYFDASYSHKYAGRPKIFLIQACQGDQKDDGMVPKRDAALDERFGMLSLKEAETTDTETTDAGLVDRTKVPRGIDMLVVTASVPGYVSWRNQLFGTWFIQAVIEIFSNLACEDDLGSMITKVTNLVSRARTVGEGFVQVSNTTRNTLSGKVYFFPGLRGQK